MAKIEDAKLKYLECIHFALIIFSTLLLFLLPLSLQNDSRVLEGLQRAETNAILRSVVETFQNDIEFHEGDGLSILASQVGVSLEALDRRIRELRGGPVVEPARWWDKVLNTTGALDDTLNTDFYRAFCRMCRTYGCRIHRGEHPRPVMGPESVQEERWKINGRGFNSNKVPNKLPTLEKGSDSHPCGAHCYRNFLDPAEKAALEEEEEKRRQLLVNATGRKKSKSNDDDEEEDEEEEEEDSDHTQTEGAGNDGVGGGESSAWASGADAGMGAGEGIPAPLSLIGGGAQEEEGLRPPTSKNGPAVSMETDTSKARIARDKKKTSGVKRGQKRVLFDDLHDQPRSPSAVGVDYGEVTSPAKIPTSNSTKIPSPPIAQPSSGPIASISEILGGASKRFERKKNIDGIGGDDIIDMEEKHNMDYQSAGDAAVRSAARKAASDGIAPPPQRPTNSREPSGEGAGSADYAPPKVFPETATGTNQVAATNTTTTTTTRPWEAWEDALLENGIEVWGRQPCKVALMVGTRTCNEVRKRILVLFTSSTTGDGVGASLLIDGDDGAGGSNWWKAQGQQNNRKKRKGGARKNANRPPAVVYQRLKRSTDEMWPQFVPCDCVEACKESCPCRGDDNFCEKFCGCNPALCGNRFQGCQCKCGVLKGKRCTTRQCPCMAAGRECDPDLCKLCVHTLHNNHSPGYQCNNFRLRLRQKRRVLMGLSGVQGWGAFLGGPGLKKDEFIGEYCGELIDQAEADRRGKVYDRDDNSYLFNLNLDWVIDARQKGNKLRFANHSTSANCRAEILMVDGDHRVAILANKDLRPGEELFYDYRYDRRVAPDWAQDDGGRARSRGRGRGRGR